MIPLPTILFMQTISIHKGCTSNLMITDRFQRSTINIKLIAFQMETINDSIPVISHLLKPILKVVDHQRGSTTLKQSFYPMKSRLFTVQRSTHVHKKSREQFVLERHAANLKFRIDNRYLIPVIKLLKRLALAGIQLEISYTN